MRASLAALLVVSCASACRQPVDPQRAWRLAAETSPTSALGPPALALREQQLRLDDAHLAPTKAYIRAIAADGILTREMKRRRGLFSRPGPLALRHDELAAELAHAMWRGPTQRVVDYRDPRFRIEIQADPSLDLVDEGTWSLWLRLDQSVTVEQTKILSHADVSSGKFALMLDPGNRVHVVMHAADRLVHFNWTVPVSERRWTHLALTFRRDDGFSLSLDGSPVEGRIKDPPFHHSASLIPCPQQTIYLGGLDRILPGSIDDLRIYDRALGAAEIRSLAAGGEALSAPAGHWSLDECEGLFVANRAPRGTPGRIGAGVVGCEPGAPALGESRAMRFSQSPEEWRAAVEALGKATGDVERLLLSNAAIGQHRADLPDETSVERILSRLDSSGFILLHYIEDTSRGRLLAFILDPHATSPVRFLDLGPLGPVSRAIEELRDALAHGAGEGSAGEDRFRRIARSLAARVWDPCEGFVAAAPELLLRLDGDLDLVPFEALTDRSGRYLIESRAFARAGPVIELAHPQPPLNGPGHVLIAGDPEFGAYAPAAFNREAARARDSLRGSSRELETVAGLLRAASGREVIVRRAAEAFESRLALSVSGAAVVHIATHGRRLRSDEPLPFPKTPLVLSGLALAGVRRTRPDDESRVDDGYLSADEISRLPLGNAQLVVLSGCGTGLGPVLPGEGQMGLATAAWIAGARASLVTLQDVEDETITDDIEAFYSAWLSGRSPAEAARAALLGAIGRARAERGHAHPSRWAALVVEGL